jgi:hypothetical protein
MLSSEVIPPDHPNMRALVVLIIGLFVGAFCGLTAARQIAAAHAYPRGVMALLQQHLGAAKAQINGAGQCNAIVARQHLEKLRSFLPELVPAITPPHTEPDAHILQLSEALGSAVDRSLATPIPADCAALTPPIREVDQACDDCHREYR